MPGVKNIILVCLSTICTSGCFPGGIIQKGGFSYHAGFIPAPGPIFSDSYNVVCFDLAEKIRRQKMSEQDRKNLGPPVIYVNNKSYRGGCERSGETSVFFLFNIWPVSDPLNPEYAIASAVQELEGDTMVNISFWHEKHYYSILGSVVVMKIKGDVIRFSEEPKTKTIKKKKRRKR